MVQDTHCRAIHIGCAYRQPSENPEPVDRLSETLSSITSNANDSLPNIPLTRDFNLPRINWDVEDGEIKFSIRPSPQYGNTVNEAMLDLVNENSLSQVTNKPERGGTISLTLCSQQAHSNLTRSIRIKEGLSDHDIVTVDLNLKVKPQRKRSRRGYIYKKADTDNLKKEIKAAWNDFVTSQPLLNSVEQNWHSFKDMSSQML